MCGLGGACCCMHKGSAAFNVNLEGRPNMTDFGRQLAFCGTKKADRRCATLDAGTLNPAPKCEAFESSKTKITTIGTENFCIIITNTSISIYCGCGVLL